MCVRTNCAKLVEGSQNSEFTLFGFERIDVLDRETNRDCRKLIRLLCSPQTYPAEACGHMCDVVYQILGMCIWDGVDFPAATECIGWLAKFDSLDRPDF